MTSMNSGSRGVQLSRVSENGAVPNDDVQVRDQLQRRPQRRQRHQARQRQGPDDLLRAGHWPAPHHHVRSRATRCPARGPPGHCHRQGGQAFGAGLLGSPQVPPTWALPLTVKGYLAILTIHQGGIHLERHPRCQAQRQPQFRHRLDRHYRRRLPRPQPHTKRARPLCNTRQSALTDRNGQRQPHGGGRPQPSRDHVHHPAVPNLQAHPQSPDGQRPASAAAPPFPDLAGHPHPSGTGTDSPTSLRLYNRGGYGNLAGPRRARSWAGRACGCG
jgi:hypothetical protein